MKESIKNLHLTSKRAKELLIDFKEPINQSEKDYIELQKEYAKEDGFDFYSKEYLKERLRICQGWRRTELRRGDKPETPEEEQWVKEYKESQEKSKRESEEYWNRKQQALNEIDEVLRKMNLEAYTQTGYYNSKEFLEIEERVNDLAKEQAFKDSDKFINIITNQDFNKLFIKNKKKIFKKEYKINWKPLTEVLPYKFWEEHRKIKSKYNIGADLV